MDKSISPKPFQDTAVEANSKNDSRDRKSSGRWTKNRHLAPHEVGLKKVATFYGRNNFTNKK